MVEENTFLEESLNDTDMKASQNNLNEKANREKLSEKANQECLIENEGKVSKNIWKYILIFLAGVAVATSFVFLFVIGIGSLILALNPPKEPTELVTDMIVGEEGEVTTITQSTLEEVLQMSELATINYEYNAVARAYSEEGESAKYYVAYNGTVKAGIDFDKIDIQVDEENKQITLTLPNSEILETIVDFGSMEYIFEDEKYDSETLSKEAYDLCEDDLSKRAESETFLLSAAKENAISAIKALVEPWVEQIDSEYTVTVK